MGSRTGGVSLILRPEHQAPKPQSNRCCSPPPVLRTRTSHQPPRARHQAPRPSPTPLNVEEVFPFATRLTGGGVAAWHQAPYPYVVASSINIALGPDAPEVRAERSGPSLSPQRVKGGEKVYHCGGGIVYHRHDEKGLNWEPGGIRSGAGVRSSGVSQESTGSSDTWETALCRLCLRQ